ncbi:MAG: HD domain-containing protein, partial [bacterium]|nr:HD domain-containing protein [bacterium]
MVDLLEKILDKPTFKDKDRALIQKAFLTAEKAHQNQKRSSGEAYITHPLNVAYFLSELGLDSTTVAACLLHDTVEDTSLTHANLEKEFGKEISFLVDGVTKLSKIEYSDKSKESKKTHIDHLNSLKKMVFAMAEDIRVILIKLADRYHNMETLKFLNKTDQKRIALETMEIYAPIAARLGMGRLKGQLEDMAFPYVYPAEYSEMMKKVKEKYKDVLGYLDKTKPLIKRQLTDANIPVLDMHSRTKHYYSLYQKMRWKDKDLDKIYDLVAMRIIVPDIKSCYEALGVI